MENCKRIPRWHELNTDHVTVKENENALINIVFKNPRIVYEPHYYNRAIKGATKDCYMRESVYRLLLNALDRLPVGYGFKIFDAWRPYEVQKFLYDEQVDKLCKKEKLSTEEAKEQAKRFVSYPDRDLLRPYVHATGGAIDLTIIDKNNQELDMGTKFDDFSSLSATDSFESSSNEQVKKNRRLLYSVMTEAGFTNYPSEWWHYDYGDPFWAAEKRMAESLFGGIYTI